MNTPSSPEGQTLRSLIESSLKIARNIGNAEAERQLMLALQSLDPPDDGGAGDVGDDVPPQSPSTGAPDIEER